MRTNIERELVTCLNEVLAIEQWGLELLIEAVKSAGDERIAEIHRTHCLQTEGHVQDIGQRLEAHGADGSHVNGTTFGLEAIGSHATNESPSTLAIMTYAFENLEIAAYHLLRGIAERADDQDTIVVVDRILEEEEEAAEILASTFDRVVEIALGEPARSAVSRPRADPIDRRRRPQD